MRPCLDVNDSRPIGREQIKQLHDMGDKADNEACARSVRHDEVGKSEGGPPGILVAPGWRLYNGVDDGKCANDRGVWRCPEWLVDSPRPLDMDHVPGSG